MADHFTPVCRPDDTQAALQDSLRRWLGRNAPFDRRAGLLASPTAVLPAWQRLVDELGLLAAGQPESAGGIGEGVNGGLADQALILQALGEALLPEPYAAVLVLAGGLLRALPGPTAAGLLAALVAGTARPVLAAREPGARHHLDAVQASLQGPAGALRLSGRKTGVRAAALATHWLVTARAADGHLALAWVQPDAPSVQRRDVPLADGSWACELGFDQTPVAGLLDLPASGLLPALLQAQDDCLLATGAEAVGVMQRLMRDTQDHLRQRRQFGVPLASFQVLQHRLADMHLDLIQASALVGATLQRLPGLSHSAGHAHERQRAVASAQVAVARACRSVGQGAVQLHGGMGVTDELAVGHAFKRLTLIAAQGGGIDGQLRRVAAATTPSGEPPCP